MSKLEQVVGIVVVITLVVARFVLTVNDSRNTILVPSVVKAPFVIERVAEWAGDGEALPIQTLASVQKRTTGS
jgi:hypothetical protein